MRKTFIAASAVVLGLIGAAPASAAIVVNEVESQRNGVTDWIELANTGNAAVDVSGYVLKDSNNNRTFAIPAGTSIPAGGYYAIDVDVGGGFGLGNPDSARVFLPGGVTELDGYSWTDHAPATYGRCTDGTGPMTWTQSATRGARQRLPAGHGAGVAGQLVRGVRRRARHLRHQRQRAGLPAVGNERPGRAVGRAEQPVDAVPDGPRRHQVGA